MVDTLLIIALILASLSFGIASLIWPHTTRRFNFGLMRLMLPVAFQVVLTRLIGIAAIAFALLITFGMVKSMLR